jgi:hypothetical protein
MSSHSGFTALIELQFDVFGITAENNTPVIRGLPE